MRCMPRLASFSRSAEARPGAAALQPLWGRRAVYCPRPAGARARGGRSHADLAQRRGLGRAAICNSKMVRDEVQRAFRIGREKLHVIYNGVDLEYFHQRRGEALRGAARAQLGCRTRDTLFLFVGSGFSRKGLAAAIDALAA